MEWSGVEQNAMEWKGTAWIGVLVKKVPAWLLSLVLTILSLAVLCYGLAALLKVLLPNGI